MTTAFYPTATTPAVREAILRFFAMRREEGRLYFYAHDLRRYVAHQITVAPGTPDRILRMLRQNGALNYHVVDRAQSYYFIAQDRGVWQ